MTILSLAPLRRPRPAAVCDAGDAAAQHALAAAAAGAVGDAERGEARSCGWFDSSWELHQGLAVNELPEAELPVAALWFADLMPVLLPASALAADSAWLQ
jgi:hypothetical protein